MIDWRPRRLLSVLFRAPLVPLQLFVFGPHTIYSDNVQEFSAPFWSLAVQLAPVLAIAAGLALIRVVLPSGLFQHYEGSTILSSHRARVLRLDVGPNRDDVS